MFDLAKYIEKHYTRGGENAATQRLIPEAQNNRTAELASPMRNPLLTRQGLDDSIGYLEQNNRPALDAQPEIQQPDFNYTYAALFTVLYVLPIGLITYGCIHLHSCPAENMITISFIVIGCLALASRIISIPQECGIICNRQQDQLPKSFPLVCLKFVLEILVICFFIAISVWIFTIKPDTKTESSPNYCEKELYNNTYYACIVGLVLFGLIFTIACCGICSVVCTLVAQGIDDDDD